MLNIFAMAKEWWTRPAGGCQVAKVAVPLTLSSLAWTIHTFVDRVFLAWYSDEALTAVFLSSTIWFAMLSLPLGICAFTSILVAQHFGGRRFDRIGSTVWQGVWVGCLGSIPIVVFLLAKTKWLVTLYAPNSQVMVDSQVYLQILSGAVPATLVGQSLASLHSGCGKTSVVMVVDAVSALVNIVLDYLWIFGHFGFERMGVCGAAWATVISVWIKVALYLLLMMTRQYRRRYHTRSGLRVHWPQMRHLIFLGGPNGLQMSLDIVGFTVFMVFVSRVGATESAATSMAFSVSAITLMPVWGLGMATSILVGQWLGANKGELAKRATGTSLTIALGYTSVMSLMFFILPEAFLSVFAQQTSVTKADIEIIAMASTLLRFVAMYNVFDALQIVWSAAVKGAGDTHFVMRTSTVMAVLLGLACWLIELSNLGVVSFWISFTFWICLLSVIYCRRFVAFEW